jgi:hypothetical protein
MSDDMVKALEQERKARKLEAIPEAVRAVLRILQERQSQVHPLVVLQKSHICKCNLLIRHISAQNFGFVGSFCNGVQ